MSRVSYVLLSPAWPSLSWMLGPSAVTDTTGGGPACSGTSLTSSVGLFVTHWTELPSIGFSRASPRRWIAAVAASPIHSSTASVAVLRNAKCLPSGAHTMSSAQPPAGSATAVSRLVATSTSAKLAAHGATP